ncbi:hypothetical protein AGRO_5314 [Agrobacterium sp. ATCC 31749]|nr:hypothetical protein AGRO_5314 [Agrobacterium sp. ATCC 31749]
MPCGRVFCYFTKIDREFVHFGIFLYWWNLISRSWIIEIEKIPVDVIF